MARAGYFCAECGCIWIASADDGKCVFCANPQQTETMLRIMDTPSAPPAAVKDEDVGAAAAAVVE